MDSNKVMYLIFSAASAIAGALLWINYFRQIDILEKERWIHIIQALIIGYLTPTLALWAYTFLGNYGLDFNGEFFNDLFYAVACVGTVEELSKLIGVLITFQILKKHLNEPIDYLIYGGLVALGFSLRENFIYYNNYGPQIASGRTIISSLVHIINTSICIYGIYRFNLFKKGTPLINGFIGISIAIVSHGMFDFFLGQQFLGHITPIFSTIIYLIGINFWLQMISNAINFSPYFNYVKISNSRHIYRSIFSWYIIVLIISSLYLYYFQSLVNATDDIVKNISEEGFVLVTLALRASRLSINKGKYIPVKIQFPIYKTKNDDEDFNIMGYKFKIRGENEQEIYFLKFMNQQVNIQALEPKHTMIKDGLIAEITCKYFTSDNVVVYLIKTNENQTEFKNYVLKPKAISKKHANGKYPQAKFMKIDEDKTGNSSTHFRYQDLIYIEDVYIKETPHQIH